jgi:hypothetical protein
MEDRATQDPRGRSRRVGSWQPGTKVPGTCCHLGTNRASGPLSSWWRRRLDIKLLRGPTAWRDHGTLEPTVHRGRWFPGPAGSLTPRSSRDQSGRSTINDWTSGAPRRLGRSSVSGPCGLRDIGAPTTLKHGATRVPSRRGTKVVDDMKVPSCRRRLACWCASLLTVPRSLDARAPRSQGGRGTSATQVAAIAGDPCTKEGIGSMLSARTWDRGPGKTSAPTSPMCRGRLRTLVARTSLGPRARQDLGFNIPRGA